VFGTEEDGWLLVQEKDGGKVGYVPGNYVEVVSTMPFRPQLCADYECSLVRLSMPLVHPLLPLPQFLTSSFRIRLPALHLLFTSTLQNSSALLPPRPRRTPSKPGQSQRLTRKARRRRAPSASAMVPYFLLVRLTRHVFEHLLSGYRAHNVDVDPP
jgi:hypothetical protein